MDDNSINFDNLKEIEEYRCILALYEEAKDFLGEYKWCKRTIKCWYEHKLGIYEKLGVFLFEIEPIDETVDRFIWVIVGDLPTVYFDESVKTGKDALEIYCELMSEWADNVIGSKSLEECYPVETEPTTENAELLKRRVAFIKKELLMTKEE